MPRAARMLLIPFATALLGIIAPDARAQNAKDAVARRLEREIFEQLIRRSGVRGQ